MKPIMIYRSLWFRRERNLRNRIGRSWGNWNWSTWSLSTSFPFMKWQPSSIGLSLIKALMTGSSSRGIKIQSPTPDQLLGLSILSAVRGDSLWLAEMTTLASGRTTSYRWTSIKFPPQLKTSATRFPRQCSKTWVLFWTKMKSSRGSLQRRSDLTFTSTTPRKWTRSRWWGKGRALPEPNLLRRCVRQVVKRRSDRSKIENCTVFQSQQIL